MNCPVSLVLISIVWLSILDNTLCVGDASVSDSVARHSRQLRATHKRQEQQQDQAQTQTQHQRRRREQDASNVVESIEVESRIVGGENVESPNVYPWFVQWAIGPLGCGGTLIDKYLVLSAASCIADNENNYNATLWIGGLESEGGQRREVVAYYIHPKFDSTIDVNDFVILVLNSPVTDVTPVMLNSDNNIPYDGQPLVTIGFGITREGSEYGSYYLKEVKVNYVDPAVCDDDYGDMFNVDPEIMFCAAAKGRDACTGDSGGPLLDGNWQQVGIVAWGPQRKDGQCARPKFPRVYSRISGRYDWIRYQQCQAYFDNFSRDSGVVLPDYCVPVRIDITYDKFPNDNEWKIIDGNNPYLNETLYESTSGLVRAAQIGAEKDRTYHTSFYLPEGTYYFVITDISGDGMCCAYGEGSFQIWDGNKFVDRNPNDDPDVKSGNFQEMRIVKFTAQRNTDLSSSYPPDPEPLLLSAAAEDREDSSSSNQQSQNQHTNIVVGPGQQSSKHTLQVEIRYDGFPKENSWVLTKQDDDSRSSDVETIYESKFGSVTKPFDVQTTTITDLDDGNYKFTMLDSGLDGLGDGAYIRIVDTTDIIKYHIVWYNEGDFQWDAQKQFKLLPLQSPVQSQSRTPGATTTIQQDLEKLSEEQQQQQEQRSSSRTKSQQPPPES